MASTKEDVATLVFRAVDEINQDLAGKARLEKNPETVLFGRGATIDSMALVSFIVAIEEEIFEESGRSVTLANEKAMSMERSPFKTLGSMIDYVFEVMGEDRSG